MGFFTGVNHLFVPEASESLGMPDEATGTDTIGPDVEVISTGKVVEDYTPSPGKANCCGQRSTVGFRRPKPKSLRDQCLERFESRTPLKPFHWHPPTPKPAVYVKVSLWEDGDHRVLRNNFLLEPDGSLNLSKIKAKWNLTRILIADREEGVFIEPLRTVDRPDYEFISPIKVAIINSQYNGGIHLVDHLTADERRWQRYRSEVRGRCLSVVNFFRDAPACSMLLFALCGAAPVYGTYHYGDRAMQLMMALFSFIMWIIVLVLQSITQATRTFAGTAFRAVSS